jgi:retron-type reverse transcriptase
VFRYQSHQAGCDNWASATVLDTPDTQALYQVLSSYFEEDFSESSYGFRPQRSAHQAASESAGVRLIGSLAL